MAEVGLPSWTGPVGVGVGVVEEEERRVELVGSER